MTFPRWTHDLSVHHPEMDEQHRKLFAVAEALSLSQDRTADEVDTLIQDLVDYTYSHFASEEAILAQAGYPQLADHQQRHQQIFRAVDNMITKHAALDHRLLAHEVSVFVAEWLVRHIRSEDMAYGRFLRGGARAEAAADPAARLAKLKAALDDGLIDADDFAARKREILAEF